MKKKIPFINSSNDYFDKPLNVLVTNWETIFEYLIIKGYTVEQIEVYEKAYFFFVHKLDVFDGATMTEDMYDVFNLDLDAMLHDYFYVKYNVSGSTHFMNIADDLMATETKRKGKSTWNAGVRRFLLKLKNLVGFSLWARYIAKRKMSIDDRIQFLNEVKTLLNKQKT